MLRRASSRNASRHRGLRTTAEPGTPRNRRVGRANPLTNTGTSRTPEESMVGAAHRNRWLGKAVYPRFASAAVHGRVGLSSERGDTVPDTATDGHSSRCTTDRFHVYRLPPEASGPDTFRSRRCRNERSREHVFRIQKDFPGDSDA